MIAGFKKEVLELKKTFESLMKEEEFAIRLLNCSSEDEIKELFASEGVSISISSAANLMFILDKIPKIMREIPEEELIAAAGGKPESGKEWVEFAGMTGGSALAAVTFALSSAETAKYLYKCYNGKQKFDPKTAALKLVNTIGSGGISILCGLAAKSAWNAEESKIMNSKST
jgi:hypothetical protein